MGWYERPGLVRELAQHQVLSDAVRAKEGFQREFNFVGRFFFSFCRPILLWLKLSRYLSQSRRGAASEDAGTQRHTVSLDMVRIGRAQNVRAHSLALSTVAREPRSSAVSGRVKARM
jgi:hypothetical protein